jgi:arginine deiminase
MRVVVALGGNALLRRGQPMTVENQREKQSGSLPEQMAKALGVTKVRVVETGGDSFEAEREQWDDGNNVVALDPGVVAARR